MLRSMTVTRLDTATCGPARPIPWAEYMVSNMSATSLRSSSLNSFTGSPGCCRTGSGYFTMVRITYLKAPDLFDVSIVISFHLQQGVAAELLVGRACNGQCDHGFSGHSRGRHDADV